MSIRYSDIDIQNLSMDDLMARATAKTLTLDPSNPFPAFREKIWEDLKAGTFVPFDERPRRVSIGHIEWDGTDMAYDAHRKSKGKPEFLVVDTGCLGFSNNSNMLKAIYSMSDFHLRPQGMKLKLGLKPVVAGRDFEVVSTRNKRGGVGKHFIYLNMHSVLSIFVRRLKGINWMTCPIDNPEHYKFQKEIADKVDLLKEELSVRNKLPEFQKSLDQNRLHKEWMARNS